MSHPGISTPIVTGNNCQQTEKRVIRWAISLVPPIVEILRSQETPVRYSEMNSNITIDDYYPAWISAIENETFLTQKHDPKSVGTSYAGFRTVAVKSQSGIKGFIESREYTVRKYKNNNPNHPPDYLQLIPNDQSMVTGSGIKPHSTTPTSSCDSFIIVSGVKQGWHIFAEHSKKIEEKESKGYITLQVEL
ncbi:hypothetical protein [Thalassoroseus pseudoceratinae]|uniref:hypothetical protein n=1 Tax=Thalassoroseus pseudoceratinae TaxID=2713176 RepID=UPI00141E7E60|nr:hypothetical protein [Thalassoroseus pseudoceratinae]